MSSDDVAAIRADFPALASGAAFFDGPGGTQTPRQVAEAVASALTNPLSNRGTTNPAEQNAEDLVLACRAAVADLLGAEPGGVIFGRSMTQLTMDVSRALAADWGPETEIVVSRLDHDANVRPWIIAAQRAGATVRWIEFDPETAELDPDSVAAAITERTRLVAVTGASNVLGSRPDLPAIAERVHAVGGLLYVDGVHLTAHAAPDLAAMGADFYACSPYKFLGPHCGVLGAAPTLLEQVWPDKLLPATDEVPERFELGTLPYELMAGTTAAIDYLAGLSPTAIGTRRERLVASYAALEGHEEMLREQVETGLRELDATVYSRARHRTPTLFFSLPGHDSADVMHALAARDIYAPASSFYAHEPCEVLGLGEPGAVRVGLAPYTDGDDIERLLSALRDIVA